MTQKNGKGKSFTELRQQLRASGYSPIPVEGKNPGLGGWQKLHNIDDQTIATWAVEHPEKVNTGLLTRYMPTLDIDILDPDAAYAIEKLVRGRFQDQGAIVVRTGRAPKRAVLFHTAEPFNKITVNLVAPDGDTSQKLELLCDGQQVVGFGIHPDTGKPYTWQGINGALPALKELPAITEEEARQLVNDAAALLCEKFDYTRKKRSTGDGQSSAEDWSTLYANILTGADLHASINSLAMKMIVAGTDAGAVVNTLRALMNQCTAEHDARWKERYDDIPRSVATAEEKVSEEAERQETNNVLRMSLEEVHAAARKWFGQDFDLTSVNATCAVAASLKLGGDPVWMLLISGSGNAKTEVAQALAGAGALVTSTITSEGALLSATRPNKRGGGKTTGGLLPQLAPEGILVIKDFTSIIAMNNNTRPSVLAALREVHDGRWQRNVGVDGGKSLTWEGRIVIVAACTTAWDAAHAVLSSCGDRFVELRMDSTKNRRASGTQTLRNTGQEVQMRQEIAAAVGGLVLHAAEEVEPSSDEEIKRLVSAADIVTLSRTGVERDYQGNVINAHMPEAPTRFAKQLMQVVRGAVAIGMMREEAMNLALRIAHDSIPPLRLSIMLDVMINPGSRPTDTRKRINKPWTTTKREMEGLDMLNILTCEEMPYQTRKGKERHNFCYSLDKSFDRSALLALVGMSEAEAEEKIKKAENKRLLDSMSDTAKRSSKMKEALREYNEHERLRAKLTVAEWDEFIARQEQDGDPKKLELSAEFASSLMQQLLAEKPAGSA
jgi:hypothetical protein